MKRTDTPIANPAVVLKEEFCDWAILYNADTDDVMGRISPVGVMVWKLMDGRHDLKEIIAEIRRHFVDVPDAIIEDVTAFVDDLAARGFVGYEFEDSDRRVDLGTEAAATAGEAERRKVNVGPDHSRPSSTCILFLHNAKTAGLTLLDYLKRIYREEERYIARGIFDLVRFSTLTPKQANKLRLVTGHFPFGFHESLFADYTYITLLREPVDRVISFYHYRRRSPQEVDYWDINHKNISLEEYVASGMSRETDNGQVRKISGVGMRVGFGECTKDMLDQAKENIEDHFSVVGLQEMFNETLALLQRTFHWPGIPHRSRNITKDRPLKESLPPQTVRVIEEYNLLDMELYAWAKERFLDRIT